jgi:hypothetical protein
LQYRSSFSSPMVGATHIMLSCFIASLSRVHTSEYGGTRIIDLVRAVEVSQKIKKTETTTTR